MTETAYMTGLLPIKNMARNQFLTDFYEYTMVQPEPLEKYMGFNETEVRKKTVDRSMSRIIPQSENRIVILALHKYKKTKSRGEYYERNKKRRNLYNR